MIERIADFLVPAMLGVTVLVAVGAMVVVVLVGEVERMTAKQKERKP